MHSLLVTSMRGARSLTDGYFEYAFYFNTAGMTRIRTVTVAATITEI